MRAAIRAARCNGKLTSMADLVAVLATRIVSGELTEGEAARRVDRAVAGAR